MFARFPPYHGLPELLYPPEPLSQLPAAELAVELTGKPVVLVGHSMRAASPSKR